MLQPALIDYPDAELVMCEQTRRLLPDVYVARKVPRTGGKQIIWNRIGGHQDPPQDIALMECRVWADTDLACNKLVTRLLAVLPAATGGPVVKVDSSSGPADLGTEREPMRQLIFEITLKGTQHGSNTPA